MYTILTLVYVVICFGLIISVLLQSAKGEGLAGAFGGGGGVSGAVFGGRGAANFLSRATTVLAVMFLSMAIILSFMSPKSSGVSSGPSAVQQAGSQPVQSAPATEVPGAEPVAPAGEQLFNEPAASDTGS